VAAGELVVDIGAGSGMLTRALLGAGARVVAIEPDRRLGARLRELPVTLVARDVLTAEWPKEPFRVVANLPFLHTADICRRLLSDPAIPLVSADLVVEWDFAAKRARLWPSTAQTVVWSAWYELAVVRRIERSAFSPPPSVAAGVLRARRRSEPLVPPREAGRYERFVRRGFREGRTARDRDPHAWADAFTSGAVRTVHGMRRPR